jgi:hypothetical protein
MHSIQNVCAPGWKRQDHPNLRIFWYEAMKKEPKRVIAEIAQHTGYRLSEKEIDAVEEYTRFSRIRKA